MIELETGQPVLLESEWVVITGGTYAENDLVECVRVGDATQKCAFYALFIASGEYPQ
jgi:hypothetical protein